MNPQEKTTFEKLSVDKKTILKWTT